LRSLRWLTGLQTTPAGLFRPVGSDSFGDKRCAPQGVRPAAAGSDGDDLRLPCRLARGWRSEWRAEAARAFAWFLGTNDLSSRWSTWTPEACRDGLHRDRPNENRGGESVVSYLLSLAEIRQLARTSGDRPKLAPLRALHA
jgi:hypothetical protein